MNKVNNRFFFSFFFFNAFFAAVFLSTARIAVKENGKQRNKTEDDCKDICILHRCCSELKFCSVQ